MKVLASILYYIMMEVLASILNISDIELIKQIWKKLFILLTSKIIPKNFLVDFSDSIVKHKKTETNVEEIDVSPEPKPLTHFKESKYFIMLNTIYEETLSEVFQSTNVKGEKNDYYFP